MWYIERAVEVEMGVVVSVVAVLARRTLAFFWRWFLSHLAPLAVGGSFGGSMSSQKQRKEREREREKERERERD